MNELRVLVSVGLVVMLLGCKPGSTIGDPPSQQEVENMSTETEQGRADTRNNPTQSGTEGPTTASAAGAGVLPDYFPLGKGCQWKYEVVARRSGQVRTASATKEVAGTQSIGGRDYSRISTGHHTKG